MLDSHWIYVSAQQSTSSELNLRFWSWSLQKNKKHPPTLKKVNSQTTASKANSQRQTKNPQVNSQTTASRANSQTTSKKSPGQFLNDSIGSQFSNDKQKIPRSILKRQTKNPQVNSQTTASRGMEHT